jgi:hypothetical protein
MKFDPRLFFGLALDHDAYNAPVLIFADWTRFTQLNAIPDLAQIPLIMGLQLRDSAENLLIHWMNHRSLDGNNDGFIHLVTNHIAEPLTSTLLTFLHTTFLSYFSTA